MSEFTTPFVPQTALGGQIVPDTEGILSRRLLAWLVDTVIVIVLSAMVGVSLAVAGLLTFGLFWHLYPLLPVIPFLYSFGFLASAAAATPGQQVVGLRVVHHTLGRRPTPLEAFVSAAVFFLSLAIFVLLPLIALVTPRKRTLQDIVAGLLMIRTQPLTPGLSAWKTRIRA